MTNNNYQIAVIFLHGGCNMHCTFCATDEKVAAFTFPQACDVLDLLGRRGFVNVVLGGGEPFAWGGDTLALAREAKARGFVVQIGTNGIAMPAGFANDPAVDRYVLPLDGPDNASHNQLRHYGEGHFACVRDRLETLRRAGKSSTISTVVTAANVDGLEDLGRLLRDFHGRGGRLHAWHLYKFVAEGRGGRAHRDALDVSIEAYDEACAQVKQAGLPFQVFKRKDMFHSRTVDFFWREDDGIKVGSEVWGSAVETSSGPSGTEERTES